MKTRCLSLLLFFPIVVFSQATNHFDYPDARWYVAETYDDGFPQNPVFGATETTIYGYLGDSLVGGTSWHKLYSTKDPAFAGDLVFEGLIRTDSDLVLFTTPSSQLDTLYDFSLEAGDYVRYPFYGNLYYTWLDTVGTITLNGELYQVYDFDEPFGMPDYFDYVDEQWIEGIGSIHGPLFPHAPETFTHEIIAGDSLILTCSFANGQQFWQHPDYDACYTQIMAGTGDQSLTAGELYPNPFRDKITLQLAGSGMFELTVLSETGQVLLRKTVGSGEEVDLSALSNGMYFMRLSNGTDARTGKVVKQ